MLHATVLDHAAGLLKRVLRFDAPADATVGTYLREHRMLGARDRAALGDLVFRVLRERRLVEHLAASLGDGPLEKRMALAASSADFAAIDRAPLPVPLRHNLPDWLADALRAQLGDEREFAALADALLAPAPLDLRANLLRGKRDAAQAALRAAGVDAQPTPYSPWGLRVVGKPSLAKLPPYQHGDVEVQDEGSQLLALLVDARRQQMVVDFCAGAGGKTLALGAAMRDSGRLYAFDTAAHRLDALKPRLQRSGLTNVHAVRVDDERDERIARLRGKVDRVLVDAPCSGLGTLRRNPDLKWRQTSDAIARFGAQQRAILDAAAVLLKPGGRLVYATCSLLVEENEAVARDFSAAQPGFAALPADEALRQARVPQAGGLTHDGYLRLWPQRHGTDGFFAALWERH
jgi:16S rRNA (cytosine967-C5)-methyltransferase